MTATGAGSDVPVFLALEVARRYYVDGQSKSEIGERMGLSRFRVARLLDRARDNGWVRIEIDAPADVDAKLSDAVQREFGLRHAVVVLPQASSGARSDVAAAASRFLQDVLSPRDLLGLAWSRSVAGAVDQLTKVPHCPVVQLTGALPDADPDGSSIELVRRFAGISGAAAYFYYAPMIFTSPGAAAVMKQQPDVARAIAMLPQVTVAAVAIGAWAPGASTVYDALAAQERQSLAAEGVVGEISGVLVDGHGQPFPAPLDERLLCASATDLAAVPHVIALAYGADRAEAVSAALRTGLLETIIIDRTIAEALVGG